MVQLKNDMDQIFGLWSVRKTKVNLIAAVSGRVILQPRAKCLF